METTTSSLPSCPQCDIIVHAVRKKRDDLRPPDIEKAVRALQENDRKEEEITNEKEPYGIRPF